MGLFDNIINDLGEWAELINQAGNPDFELIQKNPILAGKPTHIIKSPNLNKPMYRFKYDGYVNGKWTKLGKKSNWKYEYNPINGSNTIPWPNVVDYLNDRTLIGNPYSYVYVKAGQSIFVPDGNKFKATVFYPNIEDLEFIINQQNRPEFEPNFEDQISPIRLPVMMHGSYIEYLNLIENNESNRNSSETSS